MNVLISVNGRAILYPEHNLVPQSLEAKNNIWRSFMQRPGIRYQIHIPGHVFPPFQAWKNFKVKNETFRMRRGA